MNFINLFLILLIQLIMACSGGGGGGGSSSPTSNSICQDLNASNIGESGYCSCKSGYVLETSNNSCVVPTAEADNKTYSGVYNPYSPQQSQTTPCSGVVATTRTISYCLASDLTIADNSKCVDSSPTSTVFSRSGSVEVSVKSNPALSNGKEMMTCSSGMTSGTREIICNDNYVRSGTSLSNYNCVAANYTATYSSYSPTQSATTPCSGIVATTRSIVSCIRVSDSASVATSFCTDNSPTSTVSSQQGSINVSPTNPSLSNGNEIKTCDVGATDGTNSISCNSGYHEEGTTLSNNTCVSNTRACSSLPTGFSAGTQAWNSSTSSWDSCVATSCSSGYTFSSGSCLDNSSSEKLLYKQDSGFFIQSDGSLKAWGYNAVGNLGVGDSLNKSSSVSVNLSSKTVKKIYTDEVGSNCAILNDDTVKCWGTNTYGQLGNGNTTSQNQPVDVSVGGSVRELVPGNQNYCAILTTGAVKCWGKNDSGELGNGSTSTKTTPTSISFGSLTVKKLVLSKQSSNNNGCAILSDDSLKCWGHNSLGQVGNGANSTVSSPSTVGLGSGRSAKEIYMFSNISDTFSTSVCAILDNNTLKCWGYNGSGKLGIGNTTNQNLPQSVNLGSGRTAKKLYNNPEGSMCAILDNDTVKCWGKNNAYQLGDGTTVNRSSPVQISFSGSKTVKDLVMDFNNSSFAIHTDGSLSSWGSNSRGQLGTNSSSGVPELVSLSSKLVKKVVSSIFLTCLQFTDNSVSCAGDNIYLSLGDGSSVSSSSSFVSVNLGSGRTATELQSNNYSTCAVLDNNSVKCWGYNDKGQLGNGNTTNQSTPQSLL